MSDIPTAILDAAERRIRAAGYNGFSFREIAADVGIKSSSVHYHFATKQLLAAAVARRYTDRFLAAAAEELKAHDSPRKAWHAVFRRALVEDGRMCLCGALGAGTDDLPDEVAQEVRRFFGAGLEWLVSAGMSQSKATKLFALLEGAMLMATALGDISVFDRAAKKAA